MALSEMSIRHARVTGIDYTLGDSDGLTLNVTASGGKIWLFRYYWTGKQKRMFLGCYPQISLKEPRTRRDEARALVAQGIIPTSTVNSSACCSFCDRAYLRGRVRSVGGIPQAEPKGRTPEHAPANLENL